MKFKNLYDKFTKLNIIISFELHEARELQYQILVILLQQALTLQQNSYSLHEAQNLHHKFMRHNIIISFELNEARKSVAV